MPRFPDESVTCLKRVMLSRSQNFMFTPEDVETIIQETGLNEAQVYVWADNFRIRHSTDEERIRFLKAEPLEKSVNFPYINLGVSNFRHPNDFF